ncbi:MAG: DUF4931 domain-containing protein [Leptospiraceae bacterium]|nr:DUF4931 domain-containing protein [Leptospiraceae bacterium]MDW8305598.1 DUF4931 domain-containing protein [Leptospiraceae bacterium]
MSQDQEFSPSEMRWDPVYRTWSIIAPERGKRPGSFLRKEDFPQKKLSDEESPFSYLNDHATPPPILKISDPEGKYPWKIKVIPNKYPVLRVEGIIERSAEGLYDIISGVGAHEVVIEHPRSEPTSYDLSVNEILEILKVYRERILDLKKDIRFRYIMVFKNEGNLAGATIAHLHSQIVALPERPLQIQTLLNSMREHFDRKERCLYCDILSEERKIGKRIVFEDENFVILCPFASQYPFELLILPIEHNHAFEFQSDRLLYALALTLHNALARLGKSLDRPHFNLAIITAPPAIPKLTRPHYWSSLKEDFHWHLRILPRIVFQAGFEWGSGIYLNPVPPEEAAAHLKEINPY